MSSDVVKTTRRARAEPASERNAQTRRRSQYDIGNDNMQNLRFGVPEERLDRENFHYRFVNDTDDRVRRLYAQDWDIVSDEELGIDVPASRHAGKTDVGAAMRAVLMRKPRRLFEEDHAVRQKALTQELKAAELGKTVLNGPGGNDGLQADDAAVYRPNVTNRL